MVGGNIRGRVRACPRKHVHQRAQTGDRSESHDDETKRTPRGYEIRAESGGEEPMPSKQ